MVDIRRCLCGEKLFGDEHMCPMCLVDIDVIHDALDEVFN